MIFSIITKWFQVNAVSIKSPYSQKGKKPSFIEACNKQKEKRPKRARRKKASYSTLYLTFKKKFKVSRRNSLRRKKRSTSIQMIVRFWNRFTIKASLIMKGMLSIKIIFDKTRSSAPVFSIKLKFHNWAWW